MVRSKPRAIVVCGLLLAIACAPTEKASPDGRWVDTGDLGPLDRDGDGFRGDEDCDDGDASVSPAAIERCNGVDDDCDGEVDDGLTGTWYADADVDGFGDPASAVEACDGSGGLVRNGDDCRDDNAAVYPGADEQCNGIDDDCDELIDEDIDDVFYADTDGDGYGDPAVRVVGCEDASGYVLDDSDCDDDAADVNPGETEVCDEQDNDCDTEVDEGLTATYYIDLDGDGWGSVAASIEACDAPEGYVSSPGDCDDGLEHVNPDAAEVCNGIDDDCDGDTDAADSSIDWTSGITVYTDGDGDGFGDPSTASWACQAFTDQVEDGTDCDDMLTAVNPDATEVCNGIDDDCDRDIDDDDSSLDTSTADTWYADTDGDGEGDPDSAMATCVVPSGYVDNGDDCDDTDATDTDSDGTQDCADDDIDGDGLRNDWDADPYDDGIMRPPTGGLGTDGSWTVSGTESMLDWTLLTAGASAGDATLTLDDVTPFVRGDEILVLSQQGVDSGQHQLVFIDTVGTGTLTIEPPLDADYDSSSVVLVQRVPHYTTVNVPSGATLVADDWGGSGGGVIIFRATDAVTVDGEITALGAGFEGGSGVYGNTYDCTQGESYGGAGAYGSASANGGGGGCYPRREDNGDSGGGAGYGSSGSSGTNEDGNAVTTGGSTYGDSILLEWFLGSGGGGGSPDDEDDGDDASNYAAAGGDGGGFVAIFSATSISVSGVLTADGSDGGDASSSGAEVGGGGAGSGGSIYLAAPTLSLTGLVTSEGGSGGASQWHEGTAYGSAYGGAGGDGRVRLDYTSASGSTSPSAGLTAPYTD